MAWGSTIFGTGLFEDRGTLGSMKTPSANPSQMRLRDPGRVYGPYLGIEGDISQLGKVLPANTWPPPIPQMRPSLADIIRLRPSAFGSMRPKLKISGKIPYA